MAGDEEEKKADEDKDLELDLMAEAELLRLTRQYRIMEGDKEAYCEEAQKVLRRQRKILADLGERYFCLTILNRMSQKPKHYHFYLERERKETTRMLKISRSSRNRKMDKEKAGRIAVLAENQENLITAIEEEKLHMSDLEREIRRIEKQIASQRLKAASGRLLET